MGYNSGLHFYVRTKLRRAGDPGRRLMPVELAKAAANMGLSVSAKRYSPETEVGRNRRAAAYERAKVLSAKSRPR